MKARVDTSWFQVQRDLTRSDAFLSSGCVTRCLVMHLLDLHSGEDRGDSPNGNIRLTLDQAAEALGVSRPTALKAIRECEEKGMAYRTHLADRTAKDPAQRDGVTCWMVTSIPYRGKDGRVRPGRADYRVWHPGADLSHIAETVRGVGVRETAKPRAAEPLAPRKGVERVAMTPKRARAMLPVEAGDELEGVAF